MQLVTRVSFLLMCIPFPTNFRRFTALLFIYTTVFPSPATRHSPLFYRLQSSPNERSILFSKYANLSPNPLHYYSTPATLLQYHCNYCTV